MAQLESYGTIRQSHRREGRMLFTVTEIDLPGIDGDGAHRALFEQPWGWWKGGRISKHRSAPEGGVSFELWPMWLRSPARVGIEMSAPVEAGAQRGGDGEGPRTTVYRTRFFADFVGPGHYEVEHHADGVRVRSVWDGVRATGVVRPMPAAVVMRLHLGAEAGTLPFPFPKGTGFPGLAKHLAA
ncbi:MAG: hypothetical protein AAGD06_31140 [Acidobacteriota bacterium]